MTDDRIDIICSYIVIGACIIVGLLALSILVAQVMIAYKG